MSKFYQPTPEVQNKLSAELLRLFPAHFADTNIFPAGKTQVEYSNKNGEIGAFVTMHWQRKSDFKTGSDTAVFTYKEKRTDAGRERYWYCDRRRGD